MHLCTTFAVMLLSTTVVFAEGQRVPSFVAMDPGSAFLRVSSAVPAPGLAPAFYAAPSLAAPERASDKALVSKLDTRPTSTDSKKATDDDEEDDNGSGGSRSSPGKLSHSFVETPNLVPLAKRSRTSLGPHLSPIASLDVNDYVALGLISQVIRPDWRAGNAAFLGPKVAAPSTPIRARDVGLGLSLDFKFAK